MFSLKLLLEDNSELQERLDKQEKLTLSILSKLEGIDASLKVMQTRSCSPSSPMEGGVAEDKGKIRRRSIEKARKWMEEEKERRKINGNGTAYRVNGKGKSLELHSSNAWSKQRMQFLWANADVNLVSVRGDNSKSPTKNSVGSEVDSSEMKRRRGEGREGAEKLKQGGEETQDVRVC
eukprot:759551-Hanusia_phi.AAC.3